MMKIFEPKKFLVEESSGKFYDMTVNLVNYTYTVNKATSETINAFYRSFCARSSGIHFTSKDLESKILRTINMDHVVSFAVMPSPEE